MSDNEWKTLIEASYLMKADDKDLEEGTIPDDSNLTPAVEKAKKSGGNTKPKPSNNYVAAPKTQTTVGGTPMYNPTKNPF